MRQQRTADQSAKEAFTENEDRFRTLFDNSIDAQFLSEGDIFIDCNSAALRMMGCSQKADILGHHTSEFSPPMQPDGQTSLDKATDMLAIAMAKGSHRFEWVHRRADGTDFPSEVLLTPFPTNGKFLMYGIVRDTTERNHSQKALRESEARFKQLFDSVNDGIAVRDAQTFELLDANRRFCEMYGYSLQELKQLPPGSLGIHGSPDERREHVITHFQQLAKGLPILVQWQARTKDGSTFWAELNGTRITIGTRDCLLVVVRDITERKRAEEALTREKDKAQTYLDVAGIMLVAIDADQTVSLINKKGCEVLECKEKEIIGTNWFDTFVPQQERERVKGAFALLLAGEIEPVECFENVVVTKSGHEKIIAWHNAVLRDHKGEIIRSLSSGEDVTERREAENKLKRSEEAALRLARETGVIAEIGRIISSSLDIEEVYERFAEEVRKLIPFDRILVNLVNTQEGTLTTAYAAGMEVAGRSKGVVFPIAGTVTEEMLRTGAPVLFQPESIKEVHHLFPDLVRAFEAGLRSRLSALLIARGEVIGSLALWSKQEKAYGERDISLAQGVSSQIAGAIANAQLFRERKRAEEALRESEESYRSLVETSPDAIFLHDGELFVYVNPAAVRLYDAGSAEEMYGKSTFDLVHPDYREVIRNRAHVVMTTGRPTPLREIKIVRRDGSSVDVEAAAGVSYYRGKKVMQVIQRDITERKRAEEKIRASLKEKEVLLKEIHHRVKNNLQIVSSLLYLQTTRTEHPEAVSALRESRNRIKSLALIHERLYASPDLASVDMGKYTKSLVSDLRRSHIAGDSAIRLTLKVEDIPLGITEAIPCGLIINELVSNALKHAFPKGRCFHGLVCGNISSEHGEREEEAGYPGAPAKRVVGMAVPPEGATRVPMVAGEIAIQLQRENTNRITLSVSDNGIGFPEQMDFRKSPSLGLTLVNSLVDQLEGAIELDRRGGTAFTITFNVGG